MHPLLAKLLGAQQPTGKVDARRKKRGLPKGMAVVHRGKSLRMVGPFDLGPGWEMGKHPGSKRPLAARTAERRRRKKAAQCARRRTRGVVVRKQQRPYPAGHVYAGNPQKEA